VADRELAAQGWTTRMIAKDIGRASERDWPAAREQISAAL
jgi:hypothetical protein